MLYNAIFRWLQFQSRTTDFRSVDSFAPTSGLMAAISRQAVHEETTCRCQKQQRFFEFNQSSRLNRLRSLDKLNRSSLVTFMGMLLLNTAPSRDVCITDILFLTVRWSYCISHNYPLQRPISCVIVSITKFLIVVGSPGVRSRGPITGVRFELFQIGHLH